MIPGIDEEIQQEKPQPDTLTETFVKEYIHTQKAKIQTRQLIEEMLFFASCQVASASLALLLFQFAVTQVFTTWLCLFVAWIPSLSGLTEINFQKTEEGWSLKIMNRPIITIIKFTSSVAIVTISIYKIANDLEATIEAFNAVYTEIHNYERPQVENFLPPLFVPVVLASVGMVLLFGFVKGLRSPWK
ncbi:hypothetical protein Mic7113_6827 (plasmid) [Allocoleopsis franciscana PCC 7113]|uniref:Uncharacterized protein n=2 Tax=Allocoleopsis TaxID=2886347 RepID=K9WRH5_9CYAN|nr:hypothetical protein Mic7113_6827 [Allocoleopsis franciscana PCC 7113]